MGPKGVGLGALDALMKEAPDNGGGQMQGDEKEMPMGTDKGSGEVFVDRDLASGKLKRGQKVVIRGTVTVTGNKIGVSPSSIEEDSGDDVPAEESFDEDLEGDLPQD